jgi:uncharacterized RDD family membrane protein YckC
MEPGPGTDSQDKAYAERIRSSSLSELEDMYAHVDRGEYPLRAEDLRAEIRNRITGLESFRNRQTHQIVVCASLFRRLWASLIDLFIHLLILGGLFLAGRSLFLLVLSLGNDGAPASAFSVRRGPSPLQEFGAGLLAGDPAAWKNGEQWMRVGLFTLCFLSCKALLIVPAWGRKGSTPGMREAGIRLTRRTGEPIGVRRALIRFWGQYVLFGLTLGVGALWMIWDKRRQALHDKLADTCVVREYRTWEKTYEDRVYD